MRLFKTCVLVMLAGVLSGCGGDDEDTEETPSADSASSAQTPSPPNPAAIRAPVAPADNAAVRPPGRARPPGAEDGMLGNLARAAQAARGGAARQPDVTAATEVSDVPEDVSEWTDEQIETAVREGDERAADAIDARVENSANDDQLVEFLNRMLKASLPVDEETTRNQSLRQSATGRIVSHLDRSPFVSEPSSFRLTQRTSDRMRERMEDEAEAAIRGEGRLPSGGLRGLIPGASPPGAGFPGARRSGRPRGQGQFDDRALLMSIVQGLVQNGSDAAWSTLLNIVTQQQRTALALEDSTAVVFEAVFGSDNVNADATEKFAANIVSASTTARPAIELLTSLSHQVARSSLHLPDEKPGEPNPKTAPNGFTAFGIGGRGGRTGFGGQGPKDHPPLPKLNLENGNKENLAVLRGGSFLQAVQTSVAAGTDLAPETAPMISLASTLPHVGIRQATYARFAAAHVDGATSLMDEGVYREFSRDPGHLAVLKALPQVDIDRVGAANIDPNGPEASWVKATWQVVQAMRDQLKEASKDRSLKWDGRHPIRLHRGAEPEVSIHLVIPDGSESTSVQPAAADATADSGGDQNAESTSDTDENTKTPGTHIYYTRCRVTPEKTSDRKKVSDHYTARTRGVRRELTDQGVVWFDGGRRNQDGTRMTLDVLIEQVKAPGGAVFGFGVPEAPRGAGGPAVSFIVEAIAVVVKDPATAPE